MKVIKPTTLTHTQPTFHFLITSVWEWRSGTDLNELMTWANKRKNTYWVWYVPVSDDASYNIEWYQPQVEGSFVLANVEFDSRGRIVKPKKEEATA
jgi:hypothetical protein